MPKGVILIFMRIFALFIFIHFSVSAEDRVTIYKPKTVKAKGHRAYKPKLGKKIDSSMSFKHFYTSDEDALEKVKEIKEEDKEDGIKREIIAVRQGNWVNYYEIAYEKEPFNETYVVKNPEKRLNTKEMLSNFDHIKIIGVKDIYKHQYIKPKIKNIYNNYSIGGTRHDSARIITSESYENAKQTENDVYKKCIDKQKKIIESLNLPKEVSIDYYLYDYLKSQYAKIYVRNDPLMYVSNYKREEFKRYKDFATPRSILIDNRLTLVFYLDNVNYDENKKCRIVTAEVIAAQLSKQGLEHILKGMNKKDCP